MLRYKKTDIEIIRGDITEQETDAIVNAANNSLLGGVGVDGAIHSKGGRSILEQCKKIGGCPTGEAKITTAADLPSRYVIHTVGPVYGKHKGMEERLLYNAYYNSLKLALEYDLKSISFPSISTGAYGYPIEKAVNTVMQAVKDFLDKHDGIQKVVFVLYSEDNFNTYKNQFKI